MEPQCTAGCTLSGSCPSGQDCIGIPSSVLGATGQCEDTNVSPPGNGDACSPTEACPADLACLGEFLWGAGWCVPDYLAKHFYSYDAALIPEGGSPLVSSVVACGLATVPVDITVTLHLDHPRPEDLLVTLEDPNGQSGVVLDHAPWVPGPIVTFVGSGDDQVLGLWTLRVTDTVAGETGSLLGWSVYLLSNWD